eukprot:1029319-Amphidinium_carterae.1
MEFAPRKVVLRSNTANTHTHTFKRHCIERKSRLVKKVRWSILKLLEAVKHKLSFPRKLARTENYTEITN